VLGHDSRWSRETSSRLNGEELGAVMDG